MIKIDSSASCGIASLYIVSFIALFYLWTHIVSLVELLGLLRDSYIGIKSMTSIDDKDLDKLCPVL